MGILDKLKETRNSALSNPERFMFAKNQSHTGKPVNPDNALTLTSVYSAVRILSETVASLPLPVYEDLADGGKKKTKAHYLHSVLNNKANDEMNAFTFRELMMNHLLLWGNHYSEVVKDGAGRVVALYPLRPDQTFPERNENNEIVYKTVLPDGTGIILPKDKILHIPFMGYDGLVGYSPIHMAKEAIGLGLAAEEYGARFFGDGAKPPGVLESPTALSENAQKNLIKGWNNMHQGLSNSQRVAVLEEGLTYKQIGIPNDQAQFLETRKFQISEIARVFRVPPHMLGDLERATFSNIEQQSIDFVVHSIRPWLVRIEKAINTQPWGRDWGKKYFSEHKVDGLLRGDTKSRYEAYSIARQNGWLNANDIRELENLNPVEGGDQYYVPANLLPANQPRPTIQENNEQTRTLQKRGLEHRQIQSLETRSALRGSHERFLKQSFKKMFDQERKDVIAEAKKQLNTRNLSTFEAWLSDYFYSREEEYSKEFRQTLMAIAESMLQTASKEVGGNGEFTREMREFVDNYITSFASRHAGKSFRKLKRLIEGEQDDLITALQSEFDNWEETRVDHTVKEEVVRSSNAFTKTAYVALGVITIRWVSDGEPCDICEEMDGKVVGVQSKFVRSGEEVSGLTPSGDIGHAPIHDGCECTIVANS